MHFRHVTKQGPATVPRDRKQDFTLNALRQPSVTHASSSAPRAPQRLGALLLALVVATVFAVWSGQQPARADANALTDDRSVSVPTGWWSYANVTEQFVKDRLDEHDARLTDIEVHDAAAGTYTVVMVRGSGAYAVPGWWWYPRLTFDEVGQKLNEHTGRLIDLDPYVVNGQVRYAVVMVSNTGSAARTWWWSSGVTSAAVGDLLPANKPNPGDPAKRLVDLETYQVNGTKLYSAIYIANIGADAKSWQWWLNQSSASVKQRMDEFGGRITNLERQADGTYNLIQVHNSGSDDKASWVHFGLTSINQVLDVAAQHGARVFDVDTYLVNGGRRYDAVMIDNANAETRRLSDLIAPAYTDANGLPTADFGFYLKRIGGSQSAGLQTTLQYEPASSIKAVHNLTVMRSVRSGEQLNASFTYYNYPNSPFWPNTKDACPIPADEVTANRVTSTLDFGKDNMMSISDNRTTRGVVLRYGLGTVQSAAIAAGMTSTTINQDQIGCAFLGGKRNFTTLVDMGRLYEGVEDGTLLDAGQFRTEFFQPMNNGVGGALAAIVTAEANAQGKGAVAADFIARMRNHFKGGSYNVPCDQAGCSNGWVYVRTNAGRMALPVKSGGVVGERVFVYGAFVDNQFVCATCSTATLDNAVAKINVELFRAEIRSALLTW
ncbi:serine hydrolase [Micromonospora sp. KC723]|uniref:serine hydrolase n=1 Tax=Micromonospora sp. KC723 TaxID=2530381 RepID=UPI001404798B|nr:serine hydrolase [Micromonospora sp. KC723]